MKKIHLLSAGIILLLMGLPQTDASGQVIQPSQVIQPVHFDVSRNLRDIPPVPPGERERSWKDNLIKNKAGFLDEFSNPPEYPEPDPVVQDFSTLAGRDVAIQQNFDGVNNLSGVAPPDTDGDVGPNHYFQMINLSFAIWNKSGTLLYGPADNQTIWEGFDDGQPFDNANDGDPIVLYDEHADRWLVSQFALNTTNNKFYELVAISSTPDPTGSWYRYAFEFNNMPDYPKFGVWPDGYYLSINQFANGAYWAGGGACVLDRDAMIAGNPTATMVFFSLSTTYGSLLPADCDGPFPPTGTPGYFMNLGTNSLRIWELDANWSNPASSTLTLMQTLTTASYTYSGISIQQPGTGQTLDALADRLMFRLQYRDFGSHSVMLTNHTVKPDASSRAGVRWYELRNSGTTWSIYQQGTYAPSDGNSRWMASIAMNGNGDIALGYSVSSSSTYPSIRFAGQSASHPLGLGVLDIPETNIFTGTASQTGVNRWGDYSMMAVDPIGDLTFWYTQEYTTGGWNWRTRVASFLFSPLPTVPPIADFSASSTTVVAGTPVHFTDKSTQFPTSWNWSFPGGSPSSSSAKHPTVTYSTPGTYTVTLTASNGVGSDTETKTNYITVTAPPPPVADFTVNATVIAPGGSVNFTDLSSNAPTSWFWEFEGGNPATSTLQNPSVTYGAYGTYDVKLTVSNAAGGDSELKVNYITVDIAYCASQGNNWSDEWIQKVVLGSFTKNSGAAGYSDFTSDVIPVISGNTYNIALTPGYAGTVYYEYWQVWIDYNHDGDFADSGEQVFSANRKKNTVTGTITIPSSQSVTTRMRVSMRYGSSPPYCGSFTYGEVEDYTIQISGGIDPPVADFTASATTITVGQSVSFSDLSSNSPTSWSWSFEGGTPLSSSAQNPVITYNTPGVYDVSLTATNSGGSDTETKTNYITVNIAPPVADFIADFTTITAGQNVNFTDLSTGNPDSWSWSFEGATPSSSNAQHPTITYNAAGIFDVTLIAANSAGSDTESKTDYITVIVMPAPVADFTSSATNVNAGQSILFTDQSTGNPTSWSWTFEGGIPPTSTLQNPVVTYNTPGTFDVSLTATNGGGSDTETRTDYITVNVVPPVADFTANFTTVTVGQTVNFTDLSSGNPSTWSWMFEGGTPASSSLQNPSVVFNTAGVYDVSLTATNTGGNDTELKPDYITVIEEQPTYCSSTSTNWSSRWIAKVVLGSFTNNSAGAGYSDFTSMVVNTVKGNSYAIQLTPGYSFWTYKVYWRVWIDYNQDGDFTDANELVFSANNKRNMVSGTVIIPATATTGNTRMRVSMKYGSASAPCETFTYGEVEDYTVHISTSQAPAGGDNSQDLEITAYPNPADDLLNIAISGADDQRKDLRIYNSVGILTKYMAVDQPFLRIDVADLDPGLYIITVSTPQAMKQQKVIIR